MPMTEKLQQALNNPHTMPADVADMLRRDGMNCRDSMSFDTPLIVAARHNNLPIIEYIINNIKNPAERINTINSANKKEETALSTALIKNNIKIALRLLQNGADAGASLTADTIDWLQPFVDYNELKDFHNLDNENRARRALAEAEIGAYYYQELDDTTEALKWFELAAEDGSRQGMVNLATIYQKEVGELEKAVYWLRKSYPLWTEQKNRDAVVSQLKNITVQAAQNGEAAYLANMSLGYIYASNGNITSALDSFKQAEELSAQLSEHSEQNDALFTACSLLNGTSYEKQIPANDYLDISKRFEWLIQANSDEGRALLVGVAVNGDSKILQLVACYYGKENKILNESQQYPLTAQENQPYLQALATLYGWQGRPKNTLRAAGLFKKLAEENKEKNPEITYLCYLIMAFAYFQQEKEQEAYFSEAFFALDQAHESVCVSGLPKRAEIVLTISDLISNVNEDVLSAYTECLMHCYIREAGLTDINNMTVITNRLISISDHLQAYLKIIAESATEAYTHQKNSTVRASIVEFLIQLKEGVPGDEAQKIELEKAIAECSQSSIEEKNYSLQELDAAIHSYKKLATHEEGEPTNDFQEKYADVLMLRAETHLSKGQYEEALKDFTQVYEDSKLVAALVKMAHIETELGFYDEAIAHYLQLSQDDDQQNGNAISLNALRDLTRIYEELIGRDRRRDMIGDIVKSLLLTILSRDNSNIKTFESLNELEGFSQLVKDNAEIIEKINEIKEIITPQELERISQEKKEEEELRFQKLLEGQGRSAEHRILTLLSLVDSEAGNEDRLKLLHDAINRSIETIIKIEQGRVFIKNESIIIKLAKQDYLLAAYYLAKFHEQNNNALGALSLYARIIMSPEFDANDQKIKAQSRRGIEAYKRTEEGGISKIFSKQNKTREYATDLLEVVASPSTFDDPDVAIQAGLHEKSTDIDSYNNYNLTISQILGPKDEI